MKLEEWINKIRYSFALQLFEGQMKRHLIIPLAWILLLSLVMDPFGSSYGIPYLFLEPTYLGESGFLSMFLLGMGMGVFFAAYYIASYILESYRYHFLVMEDRPFFVFFINNFVFPLIYIVVFSISYFKYEFYAQGGLEWISVQRYMGLWCGLLSMYVLLSIYFDFTNSNFDLYFRKRVKNPKALIKRARSGIRKRNKVRSFFSGPFRTKSVDHGIDIDFRSMVKILNQNHGNALFLELVLLLIIVGLGLGEKNPYLQVPAGLSIYLIFSVLLMFLAAFAFWIRKLGPFTILLVLGLLVAGQKSGLFELRHHALGLDYSVEPAKYDYESIDALNNDSHYLNDYLDTRLILNDWLAGKKAHYGPNYKPKVVFLSASGGGVRSAYFTLRTLQRLDQTLDGELLGMTRLITGASGGMMGLAWYRELYYQKKVLDEQGLDMQNPDIPSDFSKNLLNRIMFKGVSSFFLPVMQEKIGSKYYISDRGFSFDHQLQENLPFLKNRRLGDYSIPERHALIPMLVMNPVIINDGRFLLISSTPVSYLGSDNQRKHDFSGAVFSEPTGVEFSKMFHNHDADSLLYVTAMRMNASFPMITPYVSLPSEPSITVMDAGIGDNYGVRNMVKFIYTFRNWLKENVSEVVIINIRDTKRRGGIKPHYGMDKLSNPFDPVGDAATAYARSGDLNNSEHLAFLNSFYEGKISMEVIEYGHNDSIGIGATLSWTLTEKEMEDIEKSVEREENSKSIERILKTLTEN